MTEHDTVYVDAAIVTRDPANPSAEALWVRGDRISEAGSRHAVLASAGPSARVVSCGGATVLPGLIDAHCHFIWFGYLTQGADCTPEATPTIEAVQQALSATEPGAEGWVTGSGYAEYELAEARHPTRFELDEAVPDVPCVLYQTSLHGCVLNSAGLRALGYRDDSPDPPRGRLGRDAAGRLDGRIYEAPAFELMQRNLNRYLHNAGRGGRIAMIESAGRRLASLGITSCTDASTDEPSFAALREADQAGRLPIRVRCLFTYQEADRLVAAGEFPESDSDRLTVGGVKVWADGGMSSRTAAVDEPYLDPPGERGLLLHTAEELAAIVRRHDSSGRQVCVHAQGERAIRAVLDAYGEVAAPGNPLRHRIEHGGAFPESLRERAAVQGILVVSQPGFLSRLGDGFLAAFGPERSEYLYPFAGLRRAGLLVAGSSDCPVIDPNPFVGMRDAVLRRTGRGRRIASREALTTLEALDLYTREAAFASHSEDRLGTLEVGKLADFVVADRDPTAVSPSAIAGTRVRKAFVGGKAVLSDTVATD